MISKRILLDSAIFTQCNVAKVKLLPHDKVGYYVALSKIVLLYCCLQTIMPTILVMNFVECWYTILFTSLTLCNKVYSLLEVCTLLSTLVVYEKF